VFERGGIFLADFIYHKNLQDGFKPPGFQMAESG
jgi:hypothetical protein